MDADEFYEQARRVARVADADEREPLDVMGVLKAIDDLRWALDDLEWEVEARLLN